MDLKMGDVILQNFQEKQLFELLKGLIGINSVNPSLVSGGNGELKIAQYIGKYLEEIRLRVEYQHIGPNRANVVGIYKGDGGGRTIMLNGHTDTVGINGMSIEPLQACFEDGKVYGRGSLDMKSGLAAMIMAVKTIADSGLKLKGDIILACVADEEYASKGTEALVEDYSADAAIVVEPTDLKICIAHKGFAWVEIGVHGKAAHGSRPQEGIDAIVKAGKLLAEIEKLGENVLAQKLHPILGSPSIHASLIAGGTELSTYPDFCTLKIERRTVPGEFPVTIEEEMKGLIDKISSQDGEFKADYNVFFFRPPLEISREELIVKILERSYKNIREMEPEFTGFGGWMDSAILADAGIPAVIFGPGGKGMHAAVEYVDFASVIATSRVLADAIVDFCGVCS